MADSDKENWHAMLTALAVGGIGSGIFSRVPQNRPKAQAPARS